MITLFKRSSFEVGIPWFKPNKVEPKVLVSEANSYTLENSCKSA
nr:MAG TPA: hypothetical protein [Bacteriophage sp.]